MKYIVALLLLLVSINSLAQKQGERLIDSLLGVLSRSNIRTNHPSVLYHLSMAYAKLKMYNEAEIAAKKTLDLSQRLNDWSGIGKAYDALGEIAYQQQKHEVSTVIFLQSLRAMQRAGNREGVAYAYRQLGWAYERLENDSVAANYWEQSFTGFRACKNNKGMAIAGEHLGNIYCRNVWRIEKWNYVEEALIAARSTGEKLTIARILSAKASRLFDIGSYAASIKEQLQALPLYEAIKDSAAIATALRFLGASYGCLNNVDVALQYYARSLQISEKLGYMQTSAQTYVSMGPMLIAKNDFKGAFEKYEKAVAIFRKPDMPGWGMPFTLQMTAGADEIYGDALQSRGQDDSARIFYERSTANLIEAGKLFETINMMDGTTETEISMTRLNLKLGNTAEARDRLKKAAKLLHHSTNMEVIGEFFRLNSFLDTMSNDYKAAFRHFNLYIHMRDSMQLAEQSKLAIQAQMTYEFEKKELKTKAAQEKRELLSQKQIQKSTLVRNISIGGFAGMLVFTGIFLNQRNKIAKGKKRSDELLLNILPAEIAEELKSKGNSEARFFDSVTVLFTDFVDFTRAGERLTPAELVEELHICFKTFDEIIGRYGIEKIKTIGDAYLAVCGLPHPDAHHAEKIVAAALEIAQFMSIRHQELGERTFRVRVGIHSGCVVAGIVGVKKFAYDIWGDTVNTAARMEQNSEAGKVNISEATYDLVKHKYACTYRGEIAAKNKGDMKMYFVEKVVYQVA